MMFCVMVFCVQVGGFEAYLLADEDEEQSGAAAVYRQVRQTRGYAYMHSC